MDKITKAIVVALFATAIIGALIFVHNSNAQNESIPNRENNHDSQDVPFSNIEDYFIKFDGVRVALGTPLSTILPFFSLDSLEEGCLDIMLYPDEFELYRFYSLNTEYTWFDGTFLVIVSNFTGEPISVQEGTISSIVARRDIAETFESHALVDGMQLGVTTQREVERAYGEPTQITSFDCTRSLRYSPRASEGFMLPLFEMYFCIDTGLLEEVWLDY